MCRCVSGLSVGGSEWHARWLRLPSDQDRATRAGGATLARTAGGPLVDGECGWAGGCPTDEVHPLLLEHTGLDPRASRWTRATIRKRSWHRTHRKERSWNTLDNHRNMRAAAVPFCARDWR